MNGFSFDFQRVAGKESSISVSAIRTKHFKRTRVPAEEEHKDFRRPLLLAYIRNMATGRVPRYLPSGPGLKCGMTAKRSLVKIHVYQRFGGIPAVIFRVEMNQRREVTIGTVQNVREVSRPKEGGRIP
jgi:hypothetical protein